MLAATCLALAIYYEARDQPIDGQLAVAEVILNRVESPRHPNDVCGVVWDPRQFSFTHDGLPENPQEPIWDSIELMAEQILDDPDQTLLGIDATHYHATYVSPYWSRVLTRTGQIGDHIFYTEES